MMFTSSIIIFKVYIKEDSLIALKAASFEQFGVTAVRSSIYWGIEGLKWSNY